jgi:hypothetical protein
MIGTKSWQFVLNRLPTRNTVLQYSWQCRGKVVSVSDAFCKICDEPFQNRVGPNRSLYGHTSRQCERGFMLSLRCPYGSSRWSQVWSRIPPRIGQTPDCTTEHMQADCAKLSWGYADVLRSFKNYQEPPRLQQNVTGSWSVPQWSHISVRSNTDV